ncbi:DUF4433 domain-containing protein [Paraburkholderia sp. BL21I4N1]|uniref:DUF4433 domain-containing protein n=1 Tax=Paraburkholderia sp. BL21I4N1 TaxID=1938801 RepID=UPI0015E3062E|nr:DUF4433 domain-containing protein [Paraburkholderia sp. BL21I4N1]
MTEFHCIMPIENLPSVQRFGIVSHENASNLPHRSVALQPVQDKRDVKQVPQGLKLHQYANLYFHARNPMMFLRRFEAGLCVLRISLDVLAVPGTVLADQNAASNYVRFLSPVQIDQLNFDRIYALDWTDDNLISYYQKKAARCAEVLVPHHVNRILITGAYVRDEAAALLARQTAPWLEVTVEPHLFFA